MLEFPPALYTEGLNKVLLEYITKRVLVPLYLSTLKQLLSIGVGIIGIPCFLKRISACIKKQVIKKAYGKDGAKLHLGQHRPPEVMPRSLSTMTVKSSPMTIWVGRSRRRMDSDVQVGLGAIVDRRRGRGHCDKERVCFEVSGVKRLM